MNKNFAMIGVAGYVAPKHLKAIRDTKNQLVAALDPHDSVGILDSYFPSTSFFTEFERFDRHVEKLSRSDDVQSVDYVSICSPNYLHDAHVRFALRVKAEAICEKPLVINPWNLDQLEDIEQEYGKRINTVLQLRQHPAVRALKEQMETGKGGRSDVCLTYVTRRGLWYDHSWKGDVDKSGGVAMNIGVHFFDFLLWVFGSVSRNLVHINQPHRMAGALELEKARVRWFLSVDEQDLPQHVREAGGYAHRSITVDGKEVDLSAGFTDLHTDVYREILKGNGYGICDAKPAIELIHQIMHSVTSMPRDIAHPVARDSFVPTAAATTVDEV